jgi:hypothetical protein
MLFPARLQVTGAKESARKPEKPPAVDGCPSFAAAYVNDNDLVRMLSAGPTAMVGFAHLFRPTYAGANVGHPSKSGGFFGFSRGLFSPDHFGPAGDTRTRDRRFALPYYRHLCAQH